MGRARTLNGAADGRRSMHAEVQLLCSGGVFIMERVDSDFLGGDEHRVDYFRRRGGLLDGRGGYSKL